MMQRMIGLGVVAALVGVGPTARAEGSRFFNLEGFGQFLDGNPESTAVTEDGAIALPSPTRERYADPSATFSAATALGDDVVVALAGEGKVLAVDRAGKTRILYQNDGELITALLGIGNDLYVALAAPARVIRVSGGKAEPVYEPQAGYIWDMTAGPKGDVYLATGEPGRVERMTSSGKAKVIFAPEQTHIRALHYDARLGLFAGGGEKGILYHSKNDDKVVALFDSGHTEITDIVTYDGYAYVAGVTGAAALASDDPGGDKGKSGKGATLRSQLVRVDMNGASETLAGSNDEGVFALALDDKGRILVATGATGRDDPRGRIYSVDAKGRTVSMEYQGPSQRITHLIALPRDALAAITGGGGRIIHLAGGYARTGVFYTQSIDTGINAMMGALEVLGSWPKGTKVTVAVRTGQTQKPDDTWSDWSQELTAPGLQRPQVPNGRYAQMRLTLTSEAAGVTPTVFRTRLAYRRQNLPPYVREVVALRKGLALVPVPREKPKGKTVSLQDSASEELRRGSGGGDEESSQPPRARQVDQPGALTVKWVAEDPNGDAMRYDVSFRPADGGTWTPLGERLDEPFVTIQSSQLPDGHYHFRVRASDAPSNPAGLARDDVRESRAVLVDNTPPRIDPLKIDTSRQRVTVRAVVADALGALADAYYSLDGQEPEMLLPDDGVLDGPGDTFTVHLGELTPGLHTFTMQVVDEAGNEAVAQETFSLR